MLGLKRALTLLLALVFVFTVLAGCGAPKTENTQNSGSGEVQKRSPQKKSLRVFKPDELLSQAEAVELTGHPVTLDTNTLNIDAETGMSTTYYKYDIPSGTLNAGLFLWQDSAAKNGENTAEASYDRDFKFVKTDQKQIQGLGEKAFYQLSNSQMHVLYSGIHFVLAFEDKDSAKNEALNLKMAQRVIENIDKKK